MNKGVPRTSVPVLNGLENENEQKREQSLPAKDPREVDV